MSEVTRAGRADGITHYLFTDDELAIAVEVTNGGNDRYTVHEPTVLEMGTRPTFYIKTEVYPPISDQERLEWFIGKFAAQDIEDQR